MSHLKSIGIDVGVIAKGLHHKSDQNTERLDALVSAENDEYNPTTIGDWGCGCDDIDTIGKALDVLARKISDLNE